MNLKDSYTHQLYAEMTNNSFGSSADFSFCTNGFNGINETESKGINIYPNPATNQLNITIDASLIGAQLNIYNVTGSLMQSTQLQIVNSTFEIQNLPTGMYVAVIKTKEASVMKRWVKM